MKSIAIWCTLTILWAAVPLQAQSTRPLKLGLGGGVTLIAGGDRDFYKDGFNVLGSASYDFPGLNIETRLDVMYHRLAGRNLSDQSDPSGPDTLLIGDFSTIAGALTASYYLSSVTRALRPYVNFGFGLYRSEQDVVHYDQPKSASATDFGLVGGFGVSFAVRRARLFAETRIHNIFGDGGSARFYPVTVGAMF